MKITRIKTPVKGKTDFYFIAGDWHFEAMDKPSYSIMCQHAKTIPKNQRKLIINGDFLDAEFLMKKNEMFKIWSKKDNGCDEFFCPKADLEFEWANKILDELGEIFPKIYFVEGNHDWRYGMFKEMCPREYAHNFDIVKRMYLEDREIPFVKYNDWLDVGKLSITHGIYCGTSALKKHYEASGGRNVVYSHVHHADSKSFICRGETKKVWSLPCFSDTNPEYIKNRDNNWEKGYGTFAMKSNGNFHLNIHVVYDDSIILSNGKEICAK